MKINCIIADDEPIARKGLKEYVEELPFLDLKACCEGPEAAIREMSRQKIDLIFLDIQMPGMTGIELVKTLRHPPMVIFITAHPAFAVQGFELEVLDYLLKPVSFERFVKAANRALDFFTLKQHGGSHPAESPFFFIKCDNRYEKIFFDEVLFVKAMENYVVIQTAAAQFISYLTFKAVEDYFPADKFVKVHKSYLVSISKISRIEGNEVIVKQHRIPISRSMKDGVMERIVNDKLLKR